MAQQNTRQVQSGPRGARGRPRPKLDHPFRTFARVMKFVGRKYWLHLILVAVCIVVSVLAMVQGTMFTRTLIDQYILPLVDTVRRGGTADYSGLRGAIIRVAGFYACGVLASFVQARLMIYVTQGSLKELRLAIFNHMESLPIRYFDTNAHGDIMSVYTNDVDTLRQMIAMSIPQLFNSSITIVSVFISMLMLSLPLTGLTVGMIVVMLLVTGRFAGASGRYFVAQQKDLGSINGFIEEMVEGQKVVKVFCHEQANLEEFTRRNEALYHSADRANTFASMIGPISGQMGTVSYVLCAVVGGALALGGIGGLTLGGLASFLTFNRSITMPISMITMQFNAIVMGLAGTDRIFKLLDQEPEVDEGHVTLVNAKLGENDEIVETEERTNLWAWKYVHRDGRVEYRKLAGDVRFDHVDFGYTDEKMVLHDVSLFAKPGQKIAFVGSTGAGKTTVTNLINRFYDIQEGTITYDGIDVKKIKKDDLRRSLGIVLQDTHLFTGTVRENIRYGKLDATNGEVVAAARLANAHGFITRLPHGYDTMLTGDGANLSQGQRQLLAIARAAIADPPALILDEATSSIDTRTEKLIQEGMDALMYGRTTFVIAHRLSTVRNSDCIMIMEQGRIVERGTHEELLEKKGRYYQLYTGKAGEPQPDKLKAGQELFGILPRDVDLDREREERIRG